MPDRDDLDLLLDSALATYADPGADSGLVKRVLAVVTAARELRERRSFFARTRMWLPWAIAMPLAASLLMWLAISRTQHAPAAKTQQAYQPERAQAPSNNAPAVAELANSNQKIPFSETKAVVHPSMHTARLKPCPFKTRDNSDCAPLPKLDVFPTPQPLTRQERSLASMATEAPVPLRQALANAQKEDDPPVHIAAIHIPPIETQP